jgi:hypothetical protein
VTYLEQMAAAIRARVPPGVLPDEDDVDGLFRIYALLARVKGEQVTAEDVHDAWAVWMLGREPEHSSIRPFCDLDPSTRREDRPFVDAIRAVGVELDPSRRVP